ncbi:MAG TPA: amidohydrolase family protein [Candidatus Sulfotelmatobacter sp.]|nr:amidohydrolase family protein [Candidatus Sulfotelmatobacter sp.]
MTPAALAALAAGGRRVRLVNGRLIDGLGTPPIAAGFVELDGDRIAATGTMAAAPPRDGDTLVLDVEGRTLMPGLIDCHAHLVYSGFRTLEELDRCPIETAAINATLNARKVLAAGYTTVRDVGTIANVAVAVRDAIAEGKVPGPRVVASGQMICATGGPADTLPPHWERKSGGFGAVADGVDAIRRTVRQQIRNGVDNIKLAASGVEVGPYAYTWMTTFSEDEVRAAIEEAHRWGRTVAIHAQSYDSVKFALRAGVDTVEHGTRMDDQTIALFKGSTSILVPTLCTLFSVLELGAKLNLMPKQREEMAVNEPLWLDSVRRAHAAGIPIAAGGDLGNRFPHGTNARELDYLVRAGLSPMEAIQAATGVAARALKRDTLVGALTPGRLADLLVVDGDPLADVRLLQDAARLALVLKGGRAVAGRLHATANGGEM